MTQLSTLINGAGKTMIDSRSYVATSGQTTFAVVYTAPLVEVFQNGVRLNATDYTATSGTSVVLTVGASIGDEVELMGFAVDASIVNTVGIFTGGAVIQGLTVGKGANAVGANTALGVSALAAGALSGNYNTAIGYNAALAITTGGYNVTIGAQAMLSNTTGGTNVALGQYALGSNVSGSSNIAIGSNSLNTNLGSSNIGIGNQAGTSLTTGSNNTIIGSVAGTAGLSDTVIIAAGSAERMRIDSSGNVGIGTSSPTASKLHIYNRTDAGGAPNTPVVRIEHQDVNAIGTGGSNGGILSFYNIQQNNTAWASDVIIGKIDFSSSQPSSGVAELNAAIWAARELSNGGEKSAYIAFSTANQSTPPTERMRISSAGTVSISGTLSTAAYTETIVALGTVAAAATLAITTGTFITATLTTATPCTFTMPTIAAGKSFILYLRQPATGTATTATFTNVKWGTAGAPTITATVGKMDILSFSSDGTAWYGAAAQGYTY